MISGFAGDLASQELAVATNTQEGGLSE